MATILDLARSTYRDNETDGLPSTKVWEPPKSEIRALFGAIYSALAALGISSAITVAKSTQAALDADLAHPADTLGLVHSDGVKNAVYRKVGASGVGYWTPVLTLDAFAAAQIAALDTRVTAIEANRGRVTARYPLVVTQDKILIPALYYSSSAISFLLREPADALFWEFNLSGSMSTEARYYFDPSDVATPVKMASSDSAPNFPNSSNFVLLASSMYGKVSSDLPLIGAQNGGLLSNMLNKGADPDRAAIFEGGALADLTAPALTALGLKRGVTGATRAYYGGALPLDTPRQGFFFFRVYVEASADNVFGDPTYYILNQNGSTLRTGGMLLERKLSARAACYVAFNRYAVGERPLSYNVGAEFSAGSPVKVTGVQAYVGPTSWGWLERDAWPESMVEQPLYGGKLYLVRGRSAPIFVDGLLGGDRTKPRTAVTVSSAPSSLADPPYAVTSRDMLDIDFDRVSYTASISTLGGVDGSSWRFGRNIDVVKGVAPISGTRSLLALGDSITNRYLLDKARAKATAIGLTATMLGTLSQLTDATAVFGEGRESWEYADFVYADTQFAPVTDVPAYLARSASGTAADSRWAFNPWLRPTGTAGGVYTNNAMANNGHLFDFGWGLARLGIATPTHVLINLGTNDVNQKDPAVSIAQCRQGLRTMIPSIRAAGAGIKIAVGLPGIPRSGKSDQKWLEEQEPIIREILSYVDGLGDANTIVIPFWAHMDPVLGWERGTVRTEGGVIASQPSDILHPTTFNRHLMAERIAAWLALG